MRLVAEKKLNPVVGHTLSLFDEAPRAHQLLGDRAVYGKVVLTT